MQEPATEVGDVGQWLIDLVSDHGGNFPTAASLADWATCSRNCRSPDLQGAALRDIVDENHPVGNASVFAGNVGNRCTDCADFAVRALHLDIQGTLAQRAVHSIARIDSRQIEVSERPGG